jgi:hypothetical protein
MAFVSSALLIVVDILLLSGRARSAMGRPGHG